MIITISIPKNSVLLIKKGDQVDFDTPFYQVNQKKQRTINIAQNLKVDKNKIFSYLKKTIGQKINKNEIVAYKKGLLFEKKIVSPIDGVVKEINHETGEVVIEFESNKNSTKKCFFKGLVKEVAKEKVSIQLKNAISFPFKETQKTAGGEIFYFNDENEFFKITEEEVVNKIALIESLKSYIEIKCEALGAIGFVCLKKEATTDLPYAIMRNFDDFKKILNLKYQYCIFSQDNQLLIFYH